MSSRADSLTTTSSCRPNRVSAVARPVRILLVEDNQVFRDALELLLGMRADVEVVAAVAAGSEAPPAAEKHRPDVGLMDYRLPGMDGVQGPAAPKGGDPDVRGGVRNAAPN